MYADAARHAQVVLEHVVAAAAVGVGGAHDVDAGDVRVDVAGDVDALHLGAVLRVAEHLVGGDDAGLQDLLVVIDVVDEAVERGDALAQAALHLAPLVRRDHARDEVERDQPLGAAVLAAGVVLRAVDGEGDADATEDDLGLVAARAHHLRRLLREPAVEAAVVLAHRAVEAVHLVEPGCHAVEGSKVRATGGPLPAFSAATARCGGASSGARRRARRRPRPRRRRATARRRTPGWRRRRCRARGSARALRRRDGRSGCGSRPGRRRSAAGRRRGTARSTTSCCRGAATIRTSRAAHRRARRRAPLPARARCRR